MADTYSTLSDAAEAFRTAYPDVAGDKSNEELQEAGYLDEDTPGVFVYMDPSIIDIASMSEDDFEAGMELERARREAAQRQAEGHINEADHPMLAARAGSAQIQVHHTALPKSGLDGKCPHCGHSTADGHERNVTEFSEMSPGSQNSTTQQFTCNHCAGEWGPVVDKPKRARAPSGSSNGLKIEANRETRNGVTRPSVGGKCRAVWDMLDDLGGPHGVSAKDARAKAVELGLDKTTCMVQFYRYRKFHGIEGRQ